MDNGRYSCHSMNERTYIDGIQQRIDRFGTWRNSNDMGYVYLAFAIIIRAVKDLVYGDEELVLSAKSFFMNGGIFVFEPHFSVFYSSLNLWLDVLGMEQLPPMIDDIVNERIDIDRNADDRERLKEYISTLEHLYLLMKVDYQETN